MTVSIVKLIVSSCFILLTDPLFSGERRSTTIAGTGSAQLNNPNGVTVDSSGHVYIPDHQDHRIRKAHYYSPGTSGILAATVGPNPFYSSKGHTVISFFNIPESVTLKIFNTAGENIFENVYENTGGSISWSPQNNSGADIPGGIYFYVLIDTANHTKCGKLFISK